MSQIEENNMSNNNFRRDRFVRVAERRVNKILENLNNLGKCSNNRNYEYHEADIKKIFREIERKVKETKLLFKVSDQHNNKFTI